MVALAVIATAWSPYKRHFPLALFLASVVVLSTWLSLADAAALLLFLVPPYLVIRYLWGRENARIGLPGVGIIVWEVLLFIYLRKYEWVGSIEWLSHPVAIIGLSYILFRILHLVVEAPSSGHLPFGPFRYTTYILAFWTLLSGPIQYYPAFCTGLNAIGRPGDDEILRHAHRLVNGLIKAFVIAPLFLMFSDIDALTAPDANWIDFLLVLYAYPVYLYLNFSGYTDAVIAIAALCGFNTLPENFNRPYLARNLMDFWGRWHMSFGTWIRHYIFTPLSKHLLSSSPPSLHNFLLAFCVVVTFLVVGAWHGTTLNFLVFGILHAFGVITVAGYGSALKALMGRKGRKSFESNPAVKAVSTAITFHFVAFTVLLFPNSVGDLIDTFGAFAG